MKHFETCYCTKQTLEFKSEFEGDTVTKIYCPTCSSRAPGNAVMFQLCEPGEYFGMWGVEYNKAELEKFDNHFRDTDDYYTSLLISGVCGPVIANDYTTGGLCRIFGMKHGPDMANAEKDLPQFEEDIAHDKPKPKKRGDK